MFTLLLIGNTRDWRSSTFVAGGDIDVVIEALGCWDREQGRMKTAVRLVAFLNEIT